MTIEQRQRGDDVLLKGTWEGRLSGLTPNQIYFPPLATAAMWLMYANRHPSTYPVSTLWAVLAALAWAWTLQELLPLRGFGAVLESRGGAKTFRQGFFRRPVAPLEVEFVAVWETTCWFGFRRYVPVLVVRPGIDSKRRVFTQIGQHRAIPLGGLSTLFGRDRLQRAQVHTEQAAMFLGVLYEGETLRKVGTGNWARVVSDAEREAWPDYWPNPYAANFEPKEREWVAPTNWPQPPQGYIPPAGWSPKPSWPLPPSGHKFWRLTELGRKRQGRLWALAAGGIAIGVVASVLSFYFSR